MPGAGMGNETTDSRLWPALPTPSVSKSLNYFNSCCQQYNQFSHSASSFFVADYLWIPPDEHDFRFQKSSLQRHQISDAARKRKMHWS
ncbi:hypothetical protein J6590_019735 [Homalodisca vitripennis]|nr:hypothetical protein J6590_019735 [Homalodisca vitripennis]